MLMAYFLFDILLRSRQVDYDTAVEIIFCEYPPIPADVYSKQIRYAIAACIDTNVFARPDSSDLLLVAEKMHLWFSAQTRRNIVKEAEAREKAVPERALLNF
uniref:DUF4158 domain-containing protein n=1 Tax=Steinernema glaseri TaxID=37863 RepID=A0A1I7Y0A3_9BILA